MSRPRKWNPRAALPARPPIITPSAGKATGSHEVLKAKGPFLGVAGLPIILACWSALTLGDQGASTSLRVIGVISIFALSAAVVVALWWEDWPGARLRPWWSGIVDSGLVVVAGVMLALLGQITLTGHANLFALLGTSEPSPNDSSGPTVLILGVLIFTVMLQLTLVTEGWPLRRLGRVKGGLIALGISWVLGRCLLWILGASAVGDGDVLAALSCISAFQVVGWVVLRGIPTTQVSRRAVRLCLGNVISIGGGVGACWILGYAIESEILAYGAASIVGAGLVVGMLFEPWAKHLLDSFFRQLLAVLITCLLAGAVLAGLSLIAQAVSVSAAETPAWTGYACNSLAAAVILHVGIFRRWPLVPH